MAESTEIRASFERRQRNLIGGIGLGAVVFALLGAIVGAISDRLGSVEAAAAGAAVGSVVGAVLGKLFGERVIAETPEPLASERSYVGARNPDEPA
jgi:hypothetical protein